MLHYIVAVYVGLRFDKNVNACLQNTSALVEAHIEKLSTLQVQDIKKVTFVVSPSQNPARDNSVKEYVINNKHRLPDIEVDCVIRPDNSNFSYGSWNYIMKKNLDQGLDFFLIEDDYIPNVDRFYGPFMEKVRSDIAFVPQWWRTDHEHQHAAISNGLMPLFAARAHFEKYGECINMTLPVEPSEGNDGVLSQMHFLDNFSSLNMHVHDIYAEYCHPFLKNNHTVAVFGNRNGIKLLVPFFRQGTY